jgi:hypothetical protein
MKFKTGKSGNPNGRPNGSVNKITEQIRKKVLDFVENNIDNIQIDFDKLKKPEYKLKFLLDLLNFTIPKMQSAKIDLQSNQIPDYSNLSDEEILKLRQIEDKITYQETDRPIIIFQDASGKEIKNPSH